ncbi:psuG [Symbiodinium necroappetens]|uniref:PsuG protein n=1 Tax=Symbiodinium necroappetens TaxID=1628268 RepID=A0A812J069_9DINO|nr:psuG [Symbiodinium necroappetens]
MDPGQLEALAKLGLECRKVSRRDIAAVLAKGQDGATTVSATMIFADKAGIPIFVTGGIGGVHRGADATWDVSADLTELGRTAVCVVCAGAKSILDLPRTLEFLETFCRQVAGYRTSDFPAFFTPRSGLATSCSVDGPEEAAEVLAQQRQACLGSGMVLAVPVPESLAAEGARVEEATRTAVEESTKLDIRGNEVTPFLLKRINELTGGESLRSNIALIKHNAEARTEVLLCLRVEWNVGHPCESRSGFAAVRGRSCCGAGACEANAPCLPTVKEGCQCPSSGKKKAARFGRDACEMLRPCPV